jgi:hypothetical protein
MKDYDEAIIELVLTAAYMHSNCGNSVQARAYANRLKTLAENDKALIAYADYIISGAKRTTATNRDLGL